MTPSFFDQLKGALRGTVLADEPLARHTSWRVGGPADLFITPADRDDLTTALRLLQTAGIPWFAIGAGSNLLVRDGGVAGAVIHSGGLQQLEIGGAGLVRAEAGIWLPQLVQETVRRGLAGLESLAGIPGTVGGAAVMNAGAGGSELGDCVASVTLVGSDGAETWDRDRCAFGYRRSELPGGKVVAAVALQLQPGDPERLTAVLQQRLQERRKAQTVAGPNAGSVFKNPPGAKAWQLIDAAGCRGRRLGGAQVAEGHTNFIINCGGAKARDILDLIDAVRAAVASQSGVTLETEIRIVGRE